MVSLHVVHLCQVLPGLAGSYHFWLVQHAQTRYQRDPHKQRTRPLATKFFMPIVPMVIYINISVQGTVYFTARRDGKDNDMLQLYSSKLIGKAKSSTFEALYLTFDGKWHQQDDIVHPFYGHRCDADRRYMQVETVWTFDLDEDILRCDKANHHGQISLALARQTPIAMSTLEPYALPARPDTIPTMFVEATWTPRRQGVDQSLLQRRKALVSRVIADFILQWKHVLHGPFNNSTFRRLAYAVIRLATLDFTVKEHTSPRQSAGGKLVQLHDLPKWNPWSENIIRHGAVSIVMCQHMQHATSLIRADFKKWILSARKNLRDAARTYLIFSMQKVLLYQISNELERHSNVEPLFTNTLTLSPKAIDILLEATQDRVPKIFIQDLAIELQDMILDKAAAGPLQRAKLGCDINIGSPFTWRWNDRDVEREESIRNRSSETPVESHIWFDGCFSGLAYK